MSRRPRRGIALPPDTRAAWQKEQGAHCSCKGTDEFCPCQNINRELAAKEAASHRAIVVAQAHQIEVIPGDHVFTPEEQLYLSAVSWRAFIQNAITPTMKKIAVDNYTKAKATLAKVGWTPPEGCPLL